MDLDPLDVIIEHDELADLDPAERRLALRTALTERVPPEALSSVVAALADSIDGYGPLTHLMEDASVTDVLVNDPAEVWCERLGTLVETDVCFRDEEELRRLISRLLLDTGMRVDASSPVCDARLPDGSRLHVVLPPVASGGGPVVSIRKWPAEVFSLDDLVEREMMDVSERDALVAAVAERKSVLVAGATGTGKTTLVGALLGLVPASERIVIVEETPELRPACVHCVSLAARPPNVEGAGAVSLTDLVRAALRMRPDRIVVGEARGPEALAALDAMSTGHAGSFLTVHARPGADALKRIVQLALQAEGAPSERTLLAQAREAIDLVVHLERRGHRRLVNEVWEVR